MSLKYPVVVVNYNNKEDSFNCLSALKKIKYDFDIFFVDNASSDGSVEFIKSKFVDIKIIDNNKNLGFAAGNNIAIKKALKKLPDGIILINNDAILDENAFVKLISSDGDIVGPVIKYSKNNKDIYDYGGYINWVLGRTKHLEKNILSNNVPEEPDYVSGAAMLIKRKVIEKIGLFDESYFLYYEDSDYCTRAKKAGFRICIEKKSLVFHKLGASLGRKSNFTAYHNLKSNLIFINKHIHGINKPIALIYWVLLTVKVILNTILSYSVK